MKGDADVPIGGDDDGIDNRPPNTDFKQQLLSPLWQPILTPKFVVRLFFLFGLTFCCIGAALLASSGTVEVVVQYDGDGTPADNKACQITEVNEGNKKWPNKKCSVTFEITEDMTQPVFLYYKATSVYQDHRLFVKSRELNQLRDVTESVTDSLLDDRCSPAVEASECQADGDTTCPPLEQPSLKTKDGKYVWPCGNVAQSFFNDVIAPLSGGGLDANLYKTTGIAWLGDIEVKFKNPAKIDLKKYRYLWDTFPRSINAPCKTPNPPGCCSGRSGACTASANVPADEQCVYDSNCPSSQTCARTWARCTADGGGSAGGAQYNPEMKNAGLVDEHFVNWMRTSARPDFRKLHGIIEADLKAGDTVQFTIVPNFRVESFGGTKSLILSTGSWMGGNGTLLGILYLVFGSIFLLFATVFILRHRNSPRKLSDTRYTFKTVAAPTTTRVTSGKVEFRRGQ